MRKRELNRFRKQLLTKREELFSRVKAARTTAKEATDADAPDLGDRALTSVSLDLSYQLSTGEREIVRRIDVALDRIEGETYGVCLNCEKKVQIGRLEAVPWARHCIECQELLDRGVL